MFGYVRGIFNLKYHIFINIILLVKSTFKTYLQNAQCTYIGN